MMAKLRGGVKGKRKPRSHRGNEAEDIGEGRKGPYRREAEDAEKTRRQRIADAGKLHNSKRS
jgi:hypothetical protein